MLHQIIGIFSKLAVKPTYAEYSFLTSYSNVYNSIESDAMFGCQYHAILNFGLTNTSDKNKITGTTNGNHSGKKLRTGTYKGNDVINNIYDLEGNMGETTLLHDGQSGEIDWTVSYHDNYHGGGLKTSGRSTRVILYAK